MEGPQEGRPLFDTSLKTSLKSFKEVGVDAKKDFKNFSGKIVGLDFFSKNFFASENKNFFSKSPFRGVKVS